MTEVDPSKGVWKVTGHLPEPDGRRMTVLVNAADGDQAIEMGRKEGMATGIRATFHSPEEIAKWEALAAKSKPMTPEEVEQARKAWANRKQQ